MNNEYGNVDWVAIAKAAYNEYGSHTAWKTFDNRPMPSWEQLPPNIQAAWRFACYGAVAKLLSIPAKNLYETPNR